MQSLFERSLHDARTKVRQESDSAYSDDALASGVALKQQILHVACKSFRSAHIAPDVLPTVFDMFTQADRSLERTFAGLGVGLTLARRLIELHGGTMEARSPGLGGGSEFIVRLPVVHAPPQQAVRPSGEDTAAVPRRRILLAEDNEDFSSSFAIILRIRTSYGQARGAAARVAHLEQCFVKMTPALPLRRKSAKLRPQ